MKRMLIPVLAMMLVLSLSLTTPQAQNTPQPIDPVDSTVTPPPSGRCAVAKVICNQIAQPIWTTCRASGVFTDAQCFQQFYSALNSCFDAEGC